MRIAQFLGNCGPGGAEAIALRLANEISVVANMESVVYVTSLQDKAWTESQLQGGEVEVKVLPPEAMEYWGVYDMLQFGKILAAILKEDGITHLHSHMYPQILRGALAAYFAEIPHIGTLHDIYSIEEKPSRIRWLKVAHWLGTKLVAVSGNMRQTYRKIGDNYLGCSFPYETPGLVYNGVDTDVFYPRECDRKEGLNLVSVGRIEPVKNYEMLMEVMRILVVTYDHTDINLTIIGDGEQRDLLERHARDFLPGNVTFLGSRDDVPELLCGADVFILGSKSEGLSCSILEAMAAGLPIIATDVGGNREIVTKDNGALVVSNDAHAFAATIVAVRKSGFLKEMGMNSRQMAEESFSLNAMVDSYINMYVDMCD